MQMKVTCAKFYTNSTKYIIQYRLNIRIQISILEHKHHTDCNLFDEKLP